MCGNSFYGADKLLDRIKNQKFSSNSSYDTIPQKTVLTYSLTIEKVGTTIKLYDDHGKVIKQDTDFATILQFAMEYGDGTIFLKKGDYELSTAITDSGNDIHLMGEPGGATTITYVGGPQEYMIILDSEYFSISDIIFDANSLCDYCVKCLSHDNLLDHCEFHFANIGGSYFVGYNNVIRNCVYSHNNLGGAILFSPQSNIRVFNNNFYDNGIYNILVQTGGIHIVERIIINGNTFWSSYYGVYFLGIGGDIYYVNIFGNICYNCNYFVCVNSDINTLNVSSNLFIDEGL